MFFFSSLGSGFLFPLIPAFALARVFFMCVFRSRGPSGRYKWNQVIIEVARRDASHRVFTQVGASHHEPSITGTDWAQVDTGWAS